MGFHTQTYLSNSQGPSTSSFHPYCCDEETQQPGGSWSCVSAARAVLHVVCSQGVCSSPASCSSITISCSCPLGKKTWQLFPSHTQAFLRSDTLESAHTILPRQRRGLSIFSHLLSGRVLLPIYLSIIFIEKSALVLHSYMS